jgi:hypothetical protein
VARYSTGSQLHVLTPIIKAGADSIGHITISA